MSSGDFSFLKGNIYTIILCSLYSNDKQSGDKYGYEIAREIKDRTDNKYEIKQPTLYSYLKKLEQQGQIQSYWGTESNGGRRRYYKLTPQGRHDCEQFIAEWEYHKNVLNSLVDTSDTPIEMSQDDVTPLFGERQKRTSPVTSKEMDEQDEIARRLSALLGEEAEAREQPTANNGDENSSFEEFDNTDYTAEEVSEEESVATNVAEETFEETEETFEENVAEDNFTTVTEAESDQVVKADVVEEDFSEEETFEEVAAVDETAATAARVVSEESTEEHKAKFDVKPQDNADDFMHKFDERARVISESRETQQPENGENYQHVLMNVIGNQLDDMQDYKSEQREGAQKYYTDHPVALEDVADDLAKQGVRMRIYNHASSNYKSKTLMPISSVLCKSAWITFAAIAVYFCVLIFTSIANNNWRPFLITISIIAVLPIGLTVFALYDPSRKDKPIFPYKRYLIATGILAAIIVLAALGISIISGIELNNYIAVSLQILLPLGIAAMLPLYVVVFYWFYKKY